MIISNWVADLIAALPADKVAPCPVCQGDYVVKNIISPTAAPCPRCNGLGRVASRLPKLPTQLCRACGAYVKHADRRAEQCPTCSSALPAWTPSRCW